MAYIILENNGVDITNIDGAVLNNFASGNRSGIIGGYLNECALSATGNSIILSTGCLLLHGIRVKITEVESVVMSSTPSQDTRYQLIAQVIVDTAGTVEFSLFAQSIQSLIQDAFLIDGMGTYQIEIGQFTHTTLGTITDIVKTANVIYGATNVDLNEIRESVQDVRSQAQSAKQEAQAVYGLASNAVATSTAAQATAQEANQIAQQAQEDVRGIEINVAEERGTVVTENGQPKAQVEWNDKLDKTPKEPKIVSDTFLTRITATNDVEIIDSPLGVKTAKINSIKGMSIKTVQKNGNFVDTDDWGKSSNINISATNNILTCTITSTPNTEHITNNADLMSYRSYYISFYIRAKLDNYVYITDDAGSFSEQFIATENRWTHISAIVTPTTTAKLRIAHDCSNYTTNDTFQVADVRCIDLTDSGLTGWSKEQLDAVIPHLPYWEGIYHSNPAQLKSIGDNLIKLEPKTITSSGVTMTVNADCTITLNGTIVDPADFPIIGSLSGDIILKYPVTDLQLIVEHISGGFTGGPLYIIGDGRLVNDGTAVYGEQIQCIIPAGSVGGVYKSAIFNNSAGYLHSIRFYVGAGLTFNKATFRIMLVHKDNPLTEYKPYTEHITILPQEQELTRWDKIDCQSNTKNVNTGKIVLSGTEGFNVSLSDDNWFAVYLNLSLGKANGEKICTHFAYFNAPFRTGDYSLPTTGTGIYNNTYATPSLLIFSISRSSFVDINAFKNYLAQQHANGTPVTVWYELAEPIIEPLEQEWDNTYPAWNYGLEQVFDADGNPTIAQMEIEYPLDLQKQIDTNTWLIQQLEKKIQELLQQ